MGQTSLDQALQIIEELDADELRQIEQAIRRRLQPQDEAAAEEAVLQALLEKGLITEIRRPSGRPAWDRPLVKIQGEPLSETIIRERR